MVHQQYRTLKKKHKRARITIHWTPGHSNVTGNKKADKQAKQAVKGETSSPEELLAYLRKPLLISKAAVRRGFSKKLTAAVNQCCKTSPRYRKLARIDPSLSITHFQKTVKDMLKHQTAMLVQLRMGHIALNVHLNRIGKMDSPTCPCCRRANEAVENFIMFCQAHAEAQRALGWVASRDAHSLKKLLSNPGTIPHLLDFVMATGRFTRQLEGVG